MAKAKKTITVSEVLKDFAQSLNDATKVLLEDIKNMSGASDDEDADDSEDDEEEVAPAKNVKATKGKKVVEEDDEEESEDDEDAPEYADVQKAVATAAKANGRDFVAGKLKQVGGKKCDHASKLKPEQYAEFIEALDEEADED